ncbi:MAG: asparagine synthase-related protein [Candidatus Kryptonium sp.]
MVKKWILGAESISLSGSITCGDPIYIYLSPSKDYVLTSKSLKELLDHPLVKKPLRISEDAISFYLQSGVIPTPRTIYKDIFLLGLGDRVVIKKIHNEIELNFCHEFPFRNSQRDIDGNFNEHYVFDCIVRHVKRAITKEAPIYLFQSLGKDSNTIALALSKSDLRDRIICLTLATNDKKDESEVASFVAKKLGLVHKKLYLPERITPKVESLLDYYFENSPYPCPDGTSLAYPLYTLQIEFKDTYVIDGSGNDVYFGHVPRPIEYKRQKIYSLFHFLRPLSELLPSGNFLQGLTKTKAEWIGLGGFTYSDTKKLYTKATMVYNYWLDETKKRGNWDYFDLKADLWGTHVELGNVIGKVQNFAHVFGATLILPWTSPEIANYIGRLPEKILFDRNLFRNKIPLRELLKKHLDLDSDKLGKYSYGFDAYALLKKMPGKVDEEIISCKLWNKREAERLCVYLRNRDKKKFFRNLLIRLFILSTWYNHNRYLR